MGAAFTSAAQATIKVTTVITGTATESTATSTVETIGPRSPTPRQMEPELIERVRRRIGPITWLNVEIAGFPRGWFILEASPLPPPHDRCKVLADICNSEYVNVTRGKLYHSHKCRSLAHELPPLYRHAVESLEDITFRVAIWPGQPDVLGGQPVAIGLDPPITYDQYPDHPHISHAIATPSGIILPDSLCYTDRPSSLGSDDYNRLVNAIDQICIWLFRHQVWLETRKISGRGKWVGPATPPFDSMFHALRLDLAGKCWCGAEAPYRDCHWTHDYAKYRTFVKEQNPGLADAVLEKHIERKRSEVIAAASGFWRLRTALLKATSAATP